MSTKNYLNLLCSDSTENKGKCAHHGDNTKEKVGHQHW